MTPKHNIHDVVPGERLRRRHPEIRKEKIAHLESKKLEFFQWFVVEHYEWGRLRERGKVARIWSEGAIEEGKRIKILFGYSPHTFVGDVLSHFRGLYKDHFGFK